MKCPKCGGELRVYCVRKGRPIIRYRKCRKCGHNEKTVES